MSKHNSQFLVNKYDILHCTNMITIEITLRKGAIDVLAEIIMKNGNKKCSVNMQKEEITNQKNMIFRNQFQCKQHPYAYFFALFLEPQLNNKTKQHKNSKYVRSCNRLLTSYPLTHYEEEGN